jgi:hypothetical protein
MGRGGLIYFTSDCPKRLKGTNLGPTNIPSNAKSEVSRLETLLCSDLNIFI